MTRWDIAYVVLIAAGLLADGTLLWPAFLRRRATDAARARHMLWAGWITLLWILAGAGLLLWHVAGRDWSALRMAWPAGSRFWLAMLLLLGVVAIYARKLVKLAGLRKTRRLKLPDTLDTIAPHTKGELVFFVALSLTAGICEEFIFRGYLIWFFQPWLGVWGAAALSLIAFGLAHAYQGAKGIINTGMAGALFTLLVLFIGSLPLAMMLHAMLDIGEGVVALYVVGGEEHA